MSSDKILFDFDDEEKENPIGSLLRYRREKKKLDLDQIAEELRVRREYLEAMERGRFDLLPSGFYRRSFLRAYAQFLKLDVDKVLNMLEERKGKSKEGEAKPVSSTKTQMEENEDKTKPKKEMAEKGHVTPAKHPTAESRAGFLFLVFLGLLIGASCLVFLFKGGIKTGQIVSTRLALAEAESLSVKPEPVDTMELFMNLLDEKIGEAPELVLRIEAKGRSWMRVISDGSELFTGFVNQNMNTEFKARDELSINLGVNEGMRAFLNGFEMKPLEKGVTYLNRENFKEFIPTNKANELVREHEENNKKASRENLVK